MKKSVFRFLATTTALPFVILTGVFMIDVDIAKANPSQCYKNIVSSYSDNEERNRATYVCQGAYSLAPAQCYKNIVSSYSDNEERNRAAKLCKVNQR